MKHSKWKAYVGWILFPEVVGALSGWLTREGSDLYSAVVRKPPLSPPPLTFPIVWGVLFALMGVSAARVYLSPPSPMRTQSLAIFFVQLAFNFFWSIIFFHLQSYGFALIWLLILWVLILWMIRSFSKVDRAAGWLQIPYLLWVTFAAYLNAGVWALNRG